MKKACSIGKIVKRDGAIARYNRKRISTAIFKATRAIERPDRELAEATARKVEQALISTYAPESMPTVEDIQDVVENVLMANGHTDVAKDYIIYRHRHTMLRAARAYSFEITDNVPYKKIYEVLRWNMDHRCESVPALNRIVEEGAFPDLVKETESRYRQEVDQAAAALLENLKATRIVIVAGPSSSGKTTTTIKISEKLKKLKVGFKAINVDHYFFNIEQHPVDDFGDHDYETPEALDLDLINSHLVQLLDGKTIKTPNYDFKTGKRTLDVHEFSLNRNEILLIDSLHGLYEGMTHSVPTENKFRLYIETLGQVKGEDGSLMRWADNRLLRRMMRDKDYRNLRPLETLAHWHYVRRSELENIIPFIKSTDFIVNSALPYELPVLKSKLFWYVARAVNRYPDDPRRLDAHIRANRVYDFLRPLKAWKDESCIPSDSLLREFIGGSRYRY